MITQAVRWLIKYVGQVLAMIESGNLARGGESLVDGERGDVGRNPCWTRQELMVMPVR